MFTSKNVEMGETRIRCPKCGSGNIIGYEGEYECMDCGYSFFIKKGGLTSFPAKRIPEEPLKKVERTKRASALICILIICFLICGYIGYCIGVNVSQVSTLLLTKTKTEFFEITKLPPRRIDFGITKMKINDTHLTIEQARRGFDNIYIKGITAKNLAYYPSIFIEVVDLQVPIPSRDTHVYNSSDYVTNLNISVTSQYQDAWDRYLKKEFGGFPIPSCNLTLVSHNVSIS